MTARERLEAVFHHEEPDRTPILGGWIACPEHICAIAGIDLDTYWSAPLAHSIDAYKRLNTDGLISCFVPRNRTDYRCVDADSYPHAVSNLSLEGCLARIDEWDDPEVIETEFDFDAEYETFKRELQDKQALCGDVVWMPAQWTAGGRVTWYGHFGYENFFMIVGMYPKQAQKLMEIGGAYGHCRSRLVARAVEEGLYPHAILLGEDICTQRGPMISPDFMEEYFAPQLKYGLQPLLDVGCKPVWHCDGDVRPILEMLFDCGVQGLQGFQAECGMRVEELVERKTREGNPLIIFGAISVTTELPFYTADQIRNRVREIIDICRGKAHLALFTANTINPDVPLENIRAMYEAIGAI